MHPFVVHIDVSNLVQILLCSVNMVNVYEQRKHHCTRFIENRIPE